jgi:hypothetical protein
MGRPPEVFVRPVMLTEGQRLQRIGRTAKYPVTASARPVSVASSRSSAAPACDTTPFPSALTLTLAPLPLRNSPQECLPARDPRSFSSSIFPYRQGTSLVSQARVALPA